MSQVIDMTGQRFGKLTVIEKVAPKPNAQGAYWRCVCDCGNEKLALGIDLRRGQCQSCGCFRKENIKRVRLQYIKNDPDWKSKRKSEKSAPCPYNEGCHCTSKDCWRCGWNPKVEKARKEAYERRVLENG